MLSALVVAATTVMLSAPIGHSGSLRAARPGGDVVHVAQTRFFQQRIPICGRGKRVTCVVDGDTIWLGGEKIRLLGIDAPEIGSTADCLKEKRTGRVATERMAAIVSSGAIELRRRGTDRYGRTLAAVLVDGRDAGEVLMREGLAVPYEGRATAAPWCR